MKDKQFIKYIENKAIKTIGKYKLIDKNDKILVACSGGKDSTVVLHILNKMFTGVEAITVNTSIGEYSRKNLANLKKFCSENKIKLHEVSFKDEFGHSLCYIHSVLRSKGFKINSCSVCGVLRRSLLNKHAKRLGKTKLVTGHNLDDEAQSALMNLLRNSLRLSSRTGPRTGLVSDKGFVPRIKPLYFCYEKEIERYSKLMGFYVVYSRCPCSTHAYRNTVRDLLNDYESRFPGTKKNIIDNFLVNQSKIKGFYSSNETISHCSRCREPSMGNICNVCRIIGEMRA